MKEKFRSYEELKKEFQSLNIQVKTDVELLSQLVNKYKATSDDDEKVTMLVDMEYLVHQYDNAQDFVKLGGFSDIVFPAMNNSIADIRSVAVHLLGSAVQSNPRVQIAALEGGAIQQLLRVLALDSDMSVRSRALYALSCLVRNFPSGQRKLIDEGGLSVFSELFDKEQQQFQKLQIKVITLLNDLIVEKQQTEDSLTKIKDPTQSEKLRQYNIINLEKQLVEKDWCTRLLKLLFVPKSDRKSKRDDLSSAVNPDIPIRPEHDVIEKVLNAMLTFSDVCMQQFQSAKQLLKQLEIQYKELAIQEQFEKDTGNETDNTGSYYYTSMSEIVVKLLNKLKTQKDEL